MQEPFQALPCQHSQQDQRSSALFFSGLGSLKLNKEQFDRDWSFSFLSETKSGKAQVIYCWFVRDVTAAMLVVKNKSISFLWELDSISM